MRPLASEADKSIDFTIVYYLKDLLGKSFSSVRVISGAASENNSARDHVIAVVCGTNQLLFLKSLVIRKLDLRLRRVYSIKLRNADLLTFIHIHRKLLPLVVNTRVKLV